jgi:DNA-binding transcriptional LysR family regulator
MDLDSLIAFVTVVNERSFSKAADTMHLTQPAISKRIQNLESKLNVRLFDRLQREIMLTEAGEALLPHALNILHDFDNAKQAIQDVGAKVQGKLRIVASHHIGLHRLPLILREFSATHPKVDLQLNFLDSESAYSLLQENAADLAFITIPEEIRADFQCHLTWEDPMSFVCGKEHELTLLTTVLPKDLAKHNAILPSQSTLTYRIVEKVFREHRLKLRANIPTNYLETMKMLASVGMGWSVMPNTMIDEELAVLPVEKPSISRQLGAVSYRKKQLGFAAKAFLSNAKQVWGGS